MESILDSIDQADDVYIERLGLIKLDSWATGAVVLVGDAAHCPTTNTGMGTTSALYILAGEINKHGRDFKKAFQAYKRKFRPFVDQVQHGVEKDGGALPGGALGVFMFNAACGLASMFRYNMFKSVLKETVKYWELPEYTDMERVASEDAS